MKKRLLKFILALFVSISPILTITNVLAIDENYDPTVMPSREYEHIDTPITNSNTRSRARSNLQAKYSSVDNGFVTDVKNQGSNGNCWAYAACSVAESYLIKHGMASKNVDLSEAHLTYYMYNNTGDPYSNTDGDNTIVASGYDYRKIGADPRAVELALSTFGLAEESKYPESLLNNGMSGTKADQYNTKYLLTNSRLICSDNTQNYKDQIKQAIFDNGSVFATYYDQSNYYGNKNSYYNPDKINILNHAISIVGWDDNFDKTNFNSQPTENGAWLIKNSWGPGFGNSGYFWMSYEESSLGYVYSFDFTKNDHLGIYQYDGTQNPLCNASITCTNIADVYKVTEDKENLTAVSIGSKSIGVPYKLKIYTNLQNPNDPLSGTPEIEQEETIQNVGMNYVQLDKEVSLQNGTYYAIVIEPHYGKQLNIFADQTNTKFLDVQYQCDYSNEYCMLKNGNDWLKQGEGNNALTYRIKGITNKYTLNKTSMNLAVGNSEQLIASQSGGSWRSSNTGIATVDRNGNVKGVGQGKATITYTVNGIELSCEVEVTDNNPITDIKLNKEILYLNQGGYETLTATILPQNATGDHTVTWSSENTNIAKVSQSGTVSAVGPGQTNIVVRTSNGKVARCQVVIQAPLQSISLSEKDFTMTKGEEKTLTVSYNPSNTTDNKNISWTSSNSSVVSVFNGKIKANNPGFATISARCNGKVATATVAVISPMTSIQLDKSTVSINPNESTYLNVSYSPSDTTDNKSVSWYSSDSGIASVNNGKVVGIKPGIATIYAECNGKKTSCEVKVKGNVSLKGFTWQVYDERILIGTAYETNTDVRFTFKSYNLDTKKWEVLDSNKKSNWQTWKPYKGNYWVYCQATTSDGKSYDQTMCFAVGKNYASYVNLNGFTWQMQDDRILIGSAYDTNDSGTQFSFKAYNLDTQKWETLSTYKSSNWQTWKPYKGNYWIYCQAKTSTGYTTDQVMCFAVGKDYGPYVHLNGYTWQMKSDAILVGSAYNTNDSDVKFTYKSYNLTTKQWQSLSDNSSSNWVTWKPERGNYWIYCQAKTSNGYTSDQTMCFAVSEDYSGNLYRIMGSSSITVDQMVNFYENGKGNVSYDTFGESQYNGCLTQGGAPDIRTYCQIFKEEAENEGVKVEVAFTQAMLETGYLKFGGDVKPDQYNFAGIGATGNGNPGNSFGDVRTGIRAQIQHLKCYASTDSLNLAKVDPRWSNNLRGKAIYVEYLSIPNNPYGTGWAASATYGNDLLKLITNLYKC